MGEELAGALDWKWGQNPFLTMAQISHRKGENSRFPRTRMGSVYVFVYGFGCVCIVHVGNNVCALVCALCVCMCVHVCAYTSTHGQSCVRLCALCMCTCVHVCTIIVRSQFRGVGSR